MSRNPWSDEEEMKLRFLYISGRPFDEIESELPERSTNAIRLKASRLGLRRPSASMAKAESPHVLRFSNGNGDSDFLFRCSGCGSWMHVDLNDDVDVSTIICRQCQTICRYVA